MTAKSKKQFNLVQALRTKYGTVENTPQKFTWIWKEDWTDVNYNTLPENNLFNATSTQDIKEFFIQHK